MSFGSKQTQAKNEATNQATTGFNNNQTVQTKDPYAAAKPGLDLAAASAQSYLADPTAAQA